MVTKDPQGNYIWVHPVTECSCSHKAASSRSRAVILWVVNRMIRNVVVVIVRRVRLILARGRDWHLGFFRRRWGGKRVRFWRWRGLGRCRVIPGKDIFEILPISCFHHTMTEVRDLIIDFHNLLVGEAGEDMIKGVINLLIAFKIDHQFGHLIFKPSTSNKPNLLAIGKCHDEIVTVDGQRSV